MSQQRKFKGLEKKRILVVEDVELNQYLARHIMQSWGCIVSIAVNGKEAVEKVQENEFDLVLMDIQMPLMDGIEATKHIRSLEDRSRAAVPIVALTANTSKGEREIYIESGMDDCLPKPFEEPSLFQTVLNNIKGGGAEASVSHGEETEGMVVVKEKLYNLSMVEAISGGDRSFIEMMLQLFLDTVPGTLGEMQGAAAKKDWLALSKLAHKLKSTIDSMGIVLIKQEIRAIEAGGKTGDDPEGLKRQLEKVVMVMGEVMGQVRRDYF